MRRHDAQRVVQMAASIYGVRVDDMTRKGARATLKLTHARHVARHAFHTWRTVTIREVARAMNCHHASAHASIGRVEADEEMTEISARIVQAMVDQEPPASEAAALGRELWAFAKVSEPARLMLATLRARLGMAAVEAAE